MSRFTDWLRERPADRAEHLAEVRARLAAGAASPDDLAAVLAGWLTSPRAARSRPPLA